MLHLSDESGRKDEELSLEEKLAKEAIVYARTWIKKGNTELVFKDEKITEDYESLGLALFTMRMRRGGILDSEKKLIDFFPEKRIYDELVRIDPNLNFYQFDFSLDFYKKYQMGNCGELTALALEYIIQNNAYHKRNIKAERYKIKNGNHIFIVIGRREGSDPSNPMDWGENAYICDPWSQKTYKASDYLLYLQDYQYEHHEKKHRLASLDKSVILEPLNENNSLQFAERNSDDYLTKLMTLTQLKSQLITDALKIFINELKQVTLSIAEQYDENDNRYKILKNKITQAEAIIASLAQINLISLDYKENPQLDRYHYYKQKLENILIPNIDRALRLQHFSPEEITLITKYKQPAKTRPKLSLGIQVLKLLEKDLKNQFSQIAEGSSNPLYEPLNKIIKELNLELTKLTSAFGDEKKEESIYPALKTYIKKMSSEVEYVMSMLAMMGTETSHLNKYLSAKKSLPDFLREFQNLLFNPAPRINKALYELHNNLMKLKMENVTQLLTAQEKAALSPTSPASGQSDHDLSEFSSNDESTLKAFTAKK